MAGRFSFEKSRLSGLVVATRLPIGDSRGFLERMFCAAEMEGAGIKKSIAQINYTLTRKKGTIRGMHFQYPPHAETKIVSCLKGEVLDVAVDIRKGSPTFLQWHSEALSESNHKSMMIPEGFAHGFQALTDDCELLYFHTEAFASDAEGGLYSQDPRLGIEWPLEVTELSERDSSHPQLTEDFIGVVL